MANGIKFQNMMAIIIFFLAGLTIKLSEYIPPLLVGFIMGIIIIVGLGFLHEGGEEES